MAETEVEIKERFRRKSGENMVSGHKHHITGLRKHKGSATRQTCFKFLLLPAGQFGKVIYSFLGQFPYL